MTIVFFYPSKNIGGVQTLFLRLGEALKDSFDIVYVDVENGFYSNSGVQSFARIVKYEGQFDSSEYSDPVIVTPPSEIIKAKNYFSGNEKVFFWHVHPYNTISTFPGFNFFNKLSKRTIKLLVKTLLLSQHRSLKKTFGKALDANALMFMDGTNKDSFHYFFDKCDSAGLLPIPVECSATFEKSQCPNRPEKEILVWVGRVEHFKSPILDYILNKFLVSSLDKNHEFHIVGDGQDLERFKSMYSHNTSIKFIGSLQPAELQQLLESDIKLSFCMGTSALECAKAGIPSVLVDAFYTAVPDNYKFKWLYESKNFSLGEVLSSKPVDNECGRELHALLEEVENNDNFVAKQCFDYVAQNHNIEVVKKRLVNGLRNSNLYIEDIGRIESTMIYRLYGCLRDRAQILTKK
ncbi:hypothetical protein CWC29_001115 [Pseudoalteromonas sp. S4498]|uniref:glycosyltransferase n=1 Tax=Pseudoalteromonas galatheae TaxID=579562 RepID=UPI00110A020A|nr:glycosyltransferase [Pseudoalteromonas galatheae]NKC17453.1 hypothetical protein [Pseudoalteromonas galatheae]